MPCDSVQLCKLELKASDRALLKKAIAVLGWGILAEDKDQLRLYADGCVSVTIRDGKFEVRAGYEHLADKLKVAYSTETVKAASRKYGWALKQTSATTFVAQRRF